MTRISALTQSIANPVLTALFLLLWLLIWPVYHWTAGRGGRSGSPSSRP